MNTWARQFWESLRALDRSVRRVLTVAVVAVLLFLAFADLLASLFIRKAEEHRRAVLVTLVTMAKSTVEPILAEVRAGRLSREEGLLQVRNLVRRMTYTDQQGPNYIFMSAYDGTMLVQPYEPPKELTDQWNLRDARGRYIIRELVAAARSAKGQGFVAYNYPPPGSSRPEAKLAFVVGIPELECYMGTGRYMQRTQKEQYQLLLWAQVGALVLVLLLLLPNLVSLRELLVRNRALAVEIEERQRAEHALAASESRLQLALESIQEGVWDWDLSTGEVYYSPDWYTTLGYAATELAPSFEGWRAIVYPEDAARVEQELAATLSGEKEQYLAEYRVLAHSGEWRWVRARGRVVSRNEAGNATRMIGTTADITEQRRVEQEHRELEARIQHAQRLESLGVLAGGIAHDFNNLLTSILGNTSLALTYLTQGSPACRHLAAVETAALRAAELTNQLLAYSGKGKFVVETMDCARLLEEMGRLLETVVPKRVTLQLDVAEDLPPIVGDPSQIRQVVMNLITNAAESFGEKEGVVGVRARRVCLSSEVLAAEYHAEELPPGEFVEFVVTDTGCGMDPETQSRVFEPFFTTKFTGRGLGMAAVLGIVRGHGGAIRVDSAVGKGTTVAILFPASQGTAPTPKTDPPDEKSAAGRTVLVVDDEEGVRSTAAAALEHYGFRVLQAADGESALAVFRAQADEIDAVVLDVTMPGPPVEETVAALLACRPGARVLLSSGYSEEAVAQRFQGVPLAGFIQKPYRPRDLADRICQLLKDA